MRNFLLQLTLVLAIAFAGISDSYALKTTTTSMQEKVHVMKATYAFGTQGGAVGTISLRDRAGNAAALPSGAIIKKAMIDVTTAMTSAGGAGTIALQSEAAGDLLATVDADTLANQVTGVPTGASATGVVKLTAKRTLSVVIATEALTAGAFTLWVEYYL